jgi:DnaJ-class molecular chaperone
MIDDEDYEDEICSWCSGSGEGMYDGSTCQKCKGSGVEPVEKDEDDCYDID